MLLYAFVIEKNPQQLSLFVDLSISLIFLLWLKEDHDFHVLGLSSGCCSPMTNQTNSSHEISASHLALYMHTDLYM